MNYHYYQSRDWKYRMYNLSNYTNMMYIDMKDSAKICCCSLLAANSPTHHFLLETNMSKGQFKQSRLGRLSEISGSFRSGWSDQTCHLEMYHPTKSCIKDSCRWLMVGLLLQFNYDSEGPNLFVRSFELLHDNPVISQQGLSWFWSGTRSLPGGGN